MPSYSSSGFGSGAGNPYGSKVGNIPLPTNLYTQVNTAIPNIANSGGTAASVINNELAGVVNPDVQNLIQNKAASMGVAQGIPGSQFQQNNELTSLGLTSMGQQEKGIADYLKFIGGTGSLMTDPNLAFNVSETNAVNAAAPNPAAASGQMQYNFDQYLNSMSGANDRSGAGANHFYPVGTSFNPSAPASANSMWDYLSLA